MLSKLARISRINRWPVALVGLVGAAILVGAGGWAAAAFAGHNRTGGVDLTTVALHAASGTASRISDRTSQPSAGQATGSGGSSTAAPHSSSEPATSNKLPLGLVVLSPQAGITANLRAGSAPTAGDSATGGGSTQFFTFGFTAQSHRNGKNAGTVSGNAEFNFPPPNGGALHVQVNCVQVAGADAYVSGRLMKPVFGLAEGTEILFGVQDGDSGSKADLMSDVFFTLSSTVSCQTFHPTPHYAVQGSIEIH